ncbi:MAG: PAS domain-containing sensor histidine kinase, partial [Alphaproteobacteria bacterium]
MAFALEADAFKRQLVDRALVLVAASYVLLLTILQARHFFDDTYETPIISQILIVYGLFCVATPWLPRLRDMFTYKVLTVQFLWLIGFGFGLWNNQLAGLTLLNVVPAAITATLFFGFRFAVLNTLISIIIFAGFGLASAGGALEPIPSDQAAFLVSHPFRWIIWGTYLSLFCLLTSYLLSVFTRYTEQYRRELDILTAAMNEAPDAFVVWDHDDRLVACNDRYVNLEAALKPLKKKGVTFEELLREGVRLGIYADAVGREEEWVAHRLAKHREGTASEILQFADGRWIHARETRTTRGYLAGFRTDITEFQDAQELLRQIMDSASEALVTFNETGVLLEVNRATCAMFNVPLEEVRGRLITDLFPKDARNEIAKTWVTHLNKGNPLAPIDLHFTQKDSSIFRGQLVIKELSAPRVKTFIAFINDTSAEYEYESQLEGLVASLEQLSTGIAIFDAKDRLAFLNSGFTTYFCGRDLELDRGLPVADFFDVLLEHRKVDKSASAQITKQGLMNFYSKPDATRELRLGIDTHVLMAGQKLENGSSVLLLADVSDYRQQRAQLEHAARLASLGEMSAGIAHEINQPLHAVTLMVSNLSIMLRRKPEQIVEYLPEKLDNIVEQINRATGITDQMRMSSREAREAGETTNVISALQSVKTLLEPQYRLANIKLEINAPENLPAVPIHTLRLEQVLINVLGNAFDAFSASDSANCWVQVRCSFNRNVIIEIEDSAG